jgi:signal transduction histidine kinase
MTVVSHDLKNMLGAIRMNTSHIRVSLKQGRREPEIRRLAARIEKTVGRMEALVRNVLDASRIDAKQLPVRPRAHDAQTIVREAVSFFETIAKRRGFALEQEVVGNPRAWCEFDLVLQVLFNLIGNAAKVVPRGGRIAVRASAEPKSGRVRFIVEDTGPGIAAELLPRIFDRFFSHDGTDDNRSAGTGLGLYIARGIVEAHGGRLWVDTRVGAGSTFSFTLPAAPHAAPESGKRRIARSARRV